MGTHIYIYTHMLFVYIYIYTHMIICLSHGNILSYEYTHIYIYIYTLFMLFVPKRGFLSLITTKSRGN